MTFVAVLPSIWPEWTERCLDTVTPVLRDGLLVIDNTVENRGVAASWNIGVDKVLADDADWLIILSAAIRFGAPGGADFLWVLEQARDRHPLALGDRHALALVIEAHHGIGWHLIAMSREVLEKVGRFDEVFFAYMEDIDWGRRFILAYSQYGEPLWEKVSVDVSIAGFAHGVDLGGVKVDNAANETTYTAKWGASKGQELYATPYGDPDLPVSFTGPYSP
jgi:hypothetical protein